MNSIEQIQYVVLKGQTEIFRSSDYNHAKWVAHGYNHHYCNPCKPHIYHVKPININSKTN